MSEEIFGFIDTETTGFKKQGNMVQEGQGRVCQIAFLLTDSTGKSLAEVSTLIKPDGWKIGEGAQKVHGFTDEQCEKYGLHAKSVFALFARLASMATLLVAHNEEFDRNMMNVEQAYYNETVKDEKYISVDNPWFCTMKTNTHITGGKWPKLEEALQHFCGRSLGDTAHDAMYDVKACRDIFFAMRKQKEQAA